MHKLAKSKIGSILDLAIEADIDGPDLTGIAAQQRAISMVHSLKACIDIASYQPDSFIAVKVYFLLISKITALAPPSLLQSWSLTLSHLENAFLKLADKDGNVGLESFQRLSESFPGLKNLDLVKLFRDNDLNSSNKLSYSDITAIFSLFSIENCRALIKDDGFKSLNHTDLDTATLVIKEIRVLCEYAQTKKVKLMMDAEQTYFQAAIDDISIGLCRNYNAKLSAGPGEWMGPLIFNTYQMYLHRTLAKLKADVYRANQKGYSFGIKLVRGAYMNSERERAARLGYESPVQDSIEASHKAYNDALTFVIEQQATLPRVTDAVRGLSLVVASHNHDSIDTTCALMNLNGISRSGGWVSFGQLLGMQDGITHSLATNGFEALKYVPYGPVEVTIPYLHRRAQENQAMVKAMSKDKVAIQSEIARRFGF